MQAEIELQRTPASASALTRAAYIAFVPIGVANVLLGPLLPTLSARWSLNYAQAGALFTAQYVASTFAVALSGAIASWRGFRFAMQAGILLVAAGLTFLLAGPRSLGIVCIAAIGAGLGIAIPPGNLMVAQLNPERRSASLNWLNFYWSAGAVACPFLVAAATKSVRVPLFLVILAGFLVLVVAGLALMPAHFVRLVSPRGTNSIFSVIHGRTRPFLILASLFLLYVGTENGFGGWVASFAKNLGHLSPAMSLITPSFFYA
jgi:fucose permease